METEEDRAKRVFGTGAKLAASAKALRRQFLKIKPAEYQTGRVRKLMRRLAVLAAELEAESAEVLGEAEELLNFYKDKP